LPKRSRWFRASIPTQLTARKVSDDVLAHREPRIDDLEKLEHYVV
jgi:hypothetical protein